MPEGEAEVPEVHVQPGESHLVREPTILRTILGSCVGITFWAPRAGLAALCHPMLPRCPVKAGAQVRPAAGRRYVDFAIRDLARQFDSLAVQRSEVRVKLFGGGDVLLVSTDKSRPTVGRLNCEAALAVLRDEGFTVAASSLGGKSGLHIRFHTGTGEVLLRRLN
jgi:chemotaxis protein CheD